MVPRCDTLAAGHPAREGAPDLPGSPCRLRRRARDWLAGSLHFNRPAGASFFETVIRLLGGLLSCWDLSGDPMFLHKARQLGDVLLWNFRAVNTRVPASTVEFPVRGRPEWPAEGLASLAEMGSDTLEFGRLALATRNTSFARAAELPLRLLHAVNPGTALLGRFVNRTSLAHTHLNLAVGGGAGRFIFRGGCGPKVLGFWGGVRVYPVMAAMASHCPRRLCSRFFS